MDEPPSYNLLVIFFSQGWLYYCFIAMFLGFASWAAAVEAAFFSLSTDDLDRFRNSEKVEEQIAASLVVEPRLLLTILSTCKYAAILAASVLSIASIVYRTNEFILLSDAIGEIIILAVLFALFGVILPKIYGSSNHIVTSRSNSKVCKRLTVFLKPVVKPLLKVSIKVEQILDSRSEQKSIEELTQALKLAAIENEPIEGEKEILEGIVNFGILTVKQVMKPRIEISYTDVSLDFHQLMDFIKRSGFSRVPVCRDSLDKIEGVLYIKDLLPFLDEGKGFAWQRLLRPGYFVPETKKIDSLLKEFQEKRVHLALVVNLQGQTTGLISLEDIIEQIIGDINDEFDEVSTRFQKINDRTFLFDGKTSLQEFCRVMRVSPDMFHPVKGMNESLGGILTEVNETLPSSGDAIIIEPFTFIIESVHNMQIRKIKVLIHEEKEH